MNKVNYPLGIKKNNITDYKENNGLLFEDMINNANQYYYQSNIALIYKIPTDINVIKVVNNTIVNAKFITPSTCDYMGNYKGKAIVFEAKSTNNTTRFDLSLLKNHQLLHLKDNYQHNGISFILIYFIKLAQIYRLDYKILEDFLNKETRKSIPIQYIIDKALLIDNVYPIDYLSNL